MRNKASLIIGTRAILFITELEIKNGRELQNMWMLFLNNEKSYIEETPLIFQRCQLHKLKYIDMETWIAD